MEKEAYDIQQMNPRSAAFNSPPITPLTIDPVPWSDPFSPRIRSLPPPPSLSKFQSITNRNQRLHEENNRFHEENKRFHEENQRLKEHVNLLSQRGWNNAGSSSDFNIINSVQLVTNIANLRDTLTNSQIWAAFQLFDKYECRRSIEFTKLYHSEIDVFNSISSAPLANGLDFRQILKFALQRLIIETILEKTQHTFKRFRQFRSGTDDLTKTLPAKIRQQTAAVLGTRTFNKKSHLFIKHLTKELVDLLNQLRTISNQQKLQDIHQMIPQLIRDVIRVLFFNLSAHEPSPKVNFYGADVPCDSELMEGRNLCFPYYW
ncbi:6028_t:CDS:2 [Ambispora gerdemannii]|uniref:6028_t:CDS:1 n=1 Tax=Ambispora gerdemannii TaxID=144530 RepID=A0A9N8V9J9_9GLOM|nr:6028_t:CDS:2 [Ambispora gerdemannii]